MTQDQYHLTRFVKAQEGVYETALAEIKDGRKRSHWMWFIFPQIEGLGQSPTSQYYAIKSIDEARQYLAHPLLGQRLRECAQALLALKDRSAEETFGFPDVLKLKSCMTLFAEVADEPGSVFSQVLEKYYHGERDEKTIAYLQRMR